MSRASNVESVMSKTTVGAGSQSQKTIPLAPPAPATTAAAAETAPSGLAAAGTPAESPASVPPKRGGGGSTPSVVSTLTPSVSGSKAASKATTGVTTALRNQISELERQLEVERKEREEAAKRIQQTQKELDALEKLLRLNPT